ncbi:signal peptide peptidase SppA [Membranihabitans maritimus]|uniref:signal peptide peptidase SppA n=1 Tax=Membranihabitans maritimus TaxID=2904244 RepID=UPI001EFFDF79|nr:signal peptide peptidase SppA [Membranihabitans maritimus]
MRTFFQSVLGSCLGVILGVLLLFLILAGIGSAFYSQGSEKPKVSSNSVLTINLAGVLPEKRNNTDVQGFEQLIEQEEILSIHDYAELIERAGNDKDIKGIYLDMSQVNIGLTKREILEKAIKTFKQSGKFVFAYSDYYSTSAYHLATLADEIAVFPTGGIDLRGLASIVPHFKTLSDKIGIEFETYFAGKFKSATEPFRLSEMSEANKLQTRSYLNSMYNVLLDDIEQNRSIDSIELQQIINAYGARNATKAMEFNLVDVVCYEDEFLEKMRDKLGLDEDEKINTVSVYDYYKSDPLSKNYSAKDKIAIVFAEGEIHDGEERYGSISGEAYVKMIRDIRRDENIKAVVLRIDSPGGSALASEKIWRELKLLQEDGIPVIASMGTYAASGGYYIASGSEYIISEPSTITGSIGVFFLLPKVSELMEDKLGINMDTVKTNNLSAAFTPFFPSSPVEQELLQSEVDQIYDIFLSRVADARKMTVDQVNEVAQGRVWTGTQAIHKGLVDQLGSLSDAIDKAASEAEIEEYRITEYPRTKQPFYKFLEQITGEELNTSIKLVKGHHLEIAKENLEAELRDWQKPQARLPIQFLWD